MYAKFTSVFAVVLAACAGVQGLVHPATCKDVEVATATSTQFLTQYTTVIAPANANARRDDDHLHQLAARQAPPTTFVTETSTRTIGQSTVTTTTTLTRTTTARATSSTTVTTTVTGNPARRTSTVTSTTTRTLTTAAPAPTSTVTTTVTKTETNTI